MIERRWIAAGLLWVSLLAAAPTGGVAAAPHLGGLVRPGFLTIGVNMPYPPMEYPNFRKQPAGADVDLGAALAAKLGLKAAYVQVDDFDTIIPKLQARRFDIIMSSMSITPERSRLVSFIPYLLSGESIVVATGNLKHIFTLADLAGLNASAQSATTEEDTIKVENRRLQQQGKPPILLKTYQDDTTALAQLVRGQSDAYLTDYPVAAYRVSHSYGSLQIAGKQFNVDTYGIAVRTADRGLRGMLASALRALRTDGSYRTILRRYNLMQGYMP